MRFVYDPAIKTKIVRMKERVRWQHTVAKTLNIDQTRVVLDLLELSDAPADVPFNSPGGQLSPQTDAPDLTGTDKDFSFLVIGDSGTSRHIKDPPQRRITKLLLKHSPECDFILHTGDVVYLVGSSEQYPDNFIKPYREFLVGGERPNKIRFDRMTFKKPFLPVLGNHDYYDLPLVSGILSRALYPIRRLLRRRINLDVGWHGSFQGEAFAKAFLDFTQLLSDRQLKEHFSVHYTAQVGSQRCLNYVPSEFTRLPNRYYTFHQAGIDFFALDSNTFNSPTPLSKDESGRAMRVLLEAERDRLEEKMRSLTSESLSLLTENAEQAARANTIYGKMEQVEEQLQDIDKQLNISQAESTVDTEQLNWLRDYLIASWKNPAAKGRVLFFHHPPYVSESSKWHQGQTLAVRARLREVLDEVQTAVGHQVSGHSRPLVDLVLCGHAHCFEYLRTLETGHGDRMIPWVVCGGSGFSLRRQRREGPVLEEYGQPVAKSHLFVGREGLDGRRSRPYSALRVDVSYEGDGEGDGEVPQFTLRPLIAEKYQGKWTETDLAPIVLERIG